MPDESDNASAGNGDTPDELATASDGAQGPEQGAGARQDPSPAVSAAMNVLKAPGGGFSPALDGATLSPAYLAALERFKPPASVSTAMAALSSPAQQRLVDSMNTPVSQIIAASMPKLPSNFFAAMGSTPTSTLTQTPALRDLMEALGRTLPVDPAPKPRRRHTASDFFAGFQAEVGSLRELL